jgi:hypothetical protein
MPPSSAQQTVLTPPFGGTLSGEIFLAPMSRDTSLPKPPMRKSRNTRRNRTVEIIGLFRCRI